MRGIRRREFGRFIAEIEKLPKTVTDFDEALWGALIDHITVHSKGKIINNTYIRMLESLGYDVR